MKIKINTNNDYYIVPVFKALQIASKILDFEVEDIRDIPIYAIKVNGKPAAYISHRDGQKLSSVDNQFLSQNEYRLIFKYHYSPSVDYGRYSDRVVACGLYRWITDDFRSQKEIFSMRRDIDVMARMRVQCSKPQPYHDAWIKARKLLIQTASELASEGYETRIGKIQRVPYAMELLHSKLAFIWTGTAYLGWKIPEFLQQGVIMIHPTLGSEHPLREDITLEDGIHFVRCDNPTDYKEVAKELLRDKQRMQSIRTNIVKLWAEKLSPMKTGEWYYRKLSEIKDQ